MNQRMVELAQQAGLKKPHGGDREYMGDFDWRAFAELMAQECSNKIEDQKVTAPPQVAAGLNFAQVIIKEHFGVES
jgi:hypothetical protein